MEESMHSGELPFFPVFGELEWTELYRVHEPQRWSVVELVGNCWLGSRVIRRETDEIPNLSGEVERIPQGFGLDLDLRLSSFLYLL